jgi:hypothetical protein
MTLVVSPTPCYVMELGRIAWAGTAAELRDHPLLTRAYLGTARDIGRVPGSPGGHRKEAEHEGRGRREVDRAEVAMSGPGVRRGFLVVADVSGYTAFFTGSELEHAHEIMREMVNWKPHAGEWTIAQCFDHLILSNRPYLPIFEEIPAGRRRPRRWERLPLLPRLFGTLLIGVLRPDSGRGAKAWPAFHPSSRHLAPAIIATFLEQQEQLLRLIEASRDLDLDRIVITSPVLRLVTYSLMDACRLLVVHEQNHLVQDHARDGVPRLSGMTGCAASARRPPRLRHPGGRPLQHEAHLIIDGAVGTRSRGGERGRETDRRTERPAWATRVLRPSLSLFAGSPPSSRGRRCSPPKGWARPAPDAPGSLRRGRHDVRPQIRGGLKDSVASLDSHPRPGLTILGAMPRSHQNLVA